MSDTGNAFRAGLVIIAGSAIAITFYLASKKFALNEDNSVDYYAYLTDASGVNAKSWITVVGLKAGEIGGIEIQEITFDEFVPDLEVRARHTLGVDVPSGGAGEVVVAPHDDFDQAIQTLIGHGALPKKEDVTDKKVSREEVLSAIAAAKKTKITVARVEFSVNKEYPLPVDTWMRKDSLGLLGAKALLLDRGPSPTMLKRGERLVNVRSLAATDALLAQAGGIVSDVRSITKKVDQDIGGITSDIRGITHELNRFIAGDENTKPLNELYEITIKDLRRLANTVEAAVRDANVLFKDKDSDFAKLIANVERITNDIADMTGKGTPAAIGPDGKPVIVMGDDGKPLDPQPTTEGDIRATMSSVRKVADDLSVVTSQLKTMLGENEGEIGENVKKLSTTIDELNRSLTSLSEVAGRVERGEGTVGRLLSDEKIADKVESAVSGAADLVASITSLETHIDIGTWYNLQRGANTTTVGLRLQPKPDKYYLIEVVDDGGRLERYTEVDQSGNVVRESIREEDNQLRISAMFAKRFFDFLVLRVGLIETTGGVGANMFFLDDRIELRTDIFDFRGPRDALAEDLSPDFFYLPRWRTYMKAQPIPHIYVSAGVDDVLNGFGPGGLQLYNDTRGYGFDYFVGVGLTFKDDDLRSILPFIPGG